MEHKVLIEIFDSNDNVKDFRESPTEITSFCIDNGFIIQVHERNESSLDFIKRRDGSNYGMKFWAKIVYTKLKCPISFMNDCGDGDTISEAIKNLAENISNKILVYNSHKKDKKEIRVPKLQHTLD